MPFYLRRYFLFLCLFLGTSLLTDCQPKAKETQETEQQSQKKKHRKRHRDRDYQPHDDQQRTQQYQSEKASRKNNGTRIQTGQIPQKVYDVLAYARANKRAMDGYVGGRRFGNFENHLPRSDTDGKPIQYQEWDVNPKVRGRNRGTQRLVTGSDGRAWFTNDHYNTFVEVK
ncbi:ribonuclease domain-containing protein [Fibrella aquatica]|jgi:ribonuclease T1|uniref:ribonuclease domain-containing protein n=1 Tax=Fibrella aquatica TaxID=3242487 RepID=UPI00352126A8